MISQSIETRGSNYSHPIVKARCGMETLLAGQKLEVFFIRPRIISRYRCTMPLNRKHIAFIRRSNQWQLSFHNRN
jgi:hypothetical protein